MILLFLALVVIIILSSSRWVKDQWKGGYLSIEQSANIKGIFAILIFIGHAVNFIDATGPLDTSYLLIKHHLDQAVVAMFFFYSGYGMTESLKKKKASYILSIPRKRVLPVYIKFLISAVIFIVFEMCLGVRFSILDICAVLAGWKDIGNYGWYVLTLSCLYMLFMFSFLAGTKNGNDNKSYIKSAGIFTLLSVILIILLKYPGRRDYWIYDTILLFAMGIWYSLFKEKIERVPGDRTRSLLVSAVTLLLYVILKLYSPVSIAFKMLWYLVFAAAVLLISMKIRIKSRVLTFYGKIAFPMLLMQGLAYMILALFRLHVSYPYVFVIAAFALTTGMSILFERCTSFIGRKR